MLYYVSLRYITLYYFVSLRSRSSLQADQHVVYRRSHHLDGGACLLQRPVAPVGTHFVWTFRGPLFRGPLIISLYVCVFSMI